MGSRIRSVLGLTSGNGNDILPNYDASTVGEVSRASRLLSSIDAGTHPTIMIAHFHGRPFYDCIAIMFSSEV